MLDERRTKMFEPCKDNIALTLGDLMWFDNLKNAGMDQVCLWLYSKKRPSRMDGNHVFFQYKNQLIGYGRFVRYQEGSVSQLFQEFGTRCGVKSYQEMLGMVYAMRKSSTMPVDLEHDRICGAYVIDSPVFYEPMDWIKSPYRGSQTLIYDNDLLLLGKKMA